MALANYTDLKASVANWLHRDDLVSQIPDFIALCEAAFNRKLRIRAMETQTTLSTVASTRGVTLPTRYRQMKRIYISGDAQKLTFVSTEEMYQRYTTNGRPKVYSIEGESVLFGPIPNAVYSVPINYFAAFQALSDSNATNWVLTNAPDVYLYGTLAAAEPHIVNDERLAMWKSLYGEAIAALQTEDDRDRASGTALTMRSDTGNP